MKSNHSIEVVKTLLQSLSLKITNEIKVKVKLLYDDAKAPLSTGSGNAGYDLFTYKVEDCGSFIKVYTGVSMAPDIGYYFFLVSRSSSYAKYGIILGNGIGILDNNYRGEIIAVFEKTAAYKGPPEVGSRLVQLIPQKQFYVEFTEVEELTPSDRGTGAFGSTGK